MQNFYQKIIHFIKYNNAFVLIVVFVLGVSGIALGNENIREGVLLGKEEMEMGVDNAVLLATDVESWSFQPQILSIETDEEYYYVSYKFRTLGVRNNIWQEIWQENLLKFPKQSDRYTDVADYITKEIGEVIQHQHQLLKDTKKIAMTEGRTQRIVVVEYNGLVGSILNLERKVIPQENPLLAEVPNLQIVLPETPAPENTETTTLPKEKEKIDKELIRKLVQEILNERKDQQSAAEQPPVEQPPVEQPSACTPNWSCGEWTPAPNTVACGQTFTQTRICTDSNNCSPAQISEGNLGGQADEGKSSEAQEETGTFCSADNATGTCQEESCNFTCTDGFSNCDEDFANGCETKGECQPLPQTDTTGGNGTAE